MFRLVVFFLTYFKATADWVQTFNEDFHDLSQWEVTHECSTHGGCIHNEEEQVYLKDQVSVRDGMLHITASKHHHYTPHTGPRKYRSGRVKSYHSFSQRHGRFEASVKLPKGQGMWPAVWMMPKNGNCWPTSGEIDIMEYVGKDPDRIHGHYHFGEFCNHHWAQTDPEICGQTGAAHHVGFQTLTNDFHRYAVEWTESYISWSIDGHEYYRLEPSKCKNPARISLPDKPFYFILNLAVGGKWPGSPDHTTNFPQTLQIDFVRAFKWE